MTDHTPTPWYVMESTGQMDSKAKFETGSKVLIFSDDCEHHPIADCSCNHSCRMPDEQEDNAAFIVKAVNAHDALVDYIKSSASAGCATADHLLKVHGIVEVGLAK
jgi:hypothetical protein